MMWEVVLLYLILALYGSAFVALLLGRSRISRSALIAASIAGVAGFLSFVYLFLSNDFAIAAVFESSSRALPVPFKIVAALEGGAGSLLLWLAMMSAGLLAYELKSSRPSRATALVVSLFALYVSIALVFMNPFAQLGGSFSNGLGLTPSLQSYWALLHPPTVFSAYTAMVFLFASIVSQRWSEQKGSVRAFFDGRLFTATWILLGLGLLFGGIWAYQTEGWGGYWAWDPIETSALIPWLALTAVVISGRDGSKLRNDYAFFGVTFSAATLMFTSYVARGSAAPSVHSYGDIVSGAPFITLSLLPVFVSLAVAAKRDTFANVKAAFKGLESTGALEFWCLILLATANLLLLLVEAIGPDFGIMLLPSAGLHDLASFPFVVGLCILLSAECVLRSSRRELIVSSAAVVLVWGATFLYALGISSNPIFELLLPSAFAMLVTALLAIAFKIVAKPRGFDMTTVFRFITVVGISILLLGVLYSSSMRTSSSATLSVGQKLQVGGQSLTVLSISTSPTSAKVYMPVYGSVSESIDTSVTYAIGNNASDAVALLKYYPGIDSYVPVPSIQSSMGGDLFVVVTQTQSVIKITAASFFNGTSGSPTQVAITAQIIPDVSLVWIGALLTLLVNLPFVFSRIERGDSGIEQRVGTPG